MEQLINSITNNNFLIITAWIIFLDSFLGILRAIKEKQFNSNVGINGAIRKVAMIGSLAFLAVLDSFFKFNLLFMIPTEWTSALNIQSIGLCDFFAILFILFEGVSVLKNMVLCGLPIPTALQTKLESFLNNMTKELEV